MMAPEDVRVENTAGDRCFNIVESNNEETHEHIVKEGTVENIHNQLYSFNNYVEGAINFTIENGEIFIESPFAGSYMIMKNQIMREELTSDGTIDANVKTPFHYRSMYSLG